jgi:hypothetical protein
MLKHVTSPLNNKIFTHLGIGISKWIFFFFSVVTLSLYIVNIIPAVKGYPNGFPLSVCDIR